MKFLYSVFAFIFITFSPVYAWDIGEKLQDKPEDVFSNTPDSLETNISAPESCRKSNIQLIFKATDKSSNKFEFLSTSIYSGKFQFFAQTLKSFKIELQKDSIKDKKAYLDLIKSLCTKIQRFESVSKPILRKRKSKSWYKFTSIWQAPNYSLIMKWSYSRSTKSFKAKRISISAFYKGQKLPPQKPQESSTDSSSDSSQNASNLPGSKVIKGKEALIKVPMITEKIQNDNLKISLERIISYYKKAQGENGNFTFGDSYTFNGSNPLHKYTFRRALSKVLKGTTFSGKVIIEPDVFRDIKKFVIFYNEYKYKTDGESKAFDMKYMRRGKLNACGIIFEIGPIKSRKAGKINKYIFVQKVPNSTKALYLLNIGHVLKCMKNKGALLAARARDSEKRNFERKVMRYLDKGIPLLWDTVGGLWTDGKFRYKDNFFDYTRIIIGYNKKNKQIIYSENLGKGYEEKRMSWEEAWAITYSVAAIKGKNTL